MRTILDLEDIMLIWDVITTDKYNEYLAATKAIR